MKTKETIYFLFGEEDVRILEEGGVEALIERGEYCELYMFTPQCNPIDLLYAFKGYSDYAILTEEEYDCLTSNL